MGTAPFTIQGDSLLYFLNIFNPGSDVNSIFIGTSGYHYSDWRPHFYPERLSPSEFLKYYADFFNFVEINNSYYRPVERKNLEKMIKQVPPGFLFSIKAHRSLTHERESDPKAEGQRFIEHTRILRDTGHLAGYLFQFPYSFHRTEKTRSYIAKICEIFTEMPLFIEFRNTDWLNGKVLKDFKNRSITMVTTDLPALKNLPQNNNKGVQEGSSIYMRFHGRNTSSWWTGDNTSRYNYTYSERELAIRMEDILPFRDNKKRLFIAFNNHYKGQAVWNAIQMKNLLKTGDPEK